MRFEFDPEKDDANRGKHGVSLSFGARVFEDADYLLIPTFREEDGEDRYKVIGIVGGLIPRARYKFDGNIAAKHRASEMEIHPGALLAALPANLSMTYALPASTTAVESNPKNRPRRTAVRG